MATTKNKQNSQPKVNDLVKSFGLKKEVIIEALGDSSKTTTSALEPSEFDKIINTLTLQNQVSSITKYLSGEIVIKGKEKAPAEKPKKEAEKPSVETPSNNKEEKTANTEQKKETPIKKAEVPVANQENKQEPKPEAKEKAPVVAPKQPPIPENKRTSNKPYSGNPFHPGEAMPIRQGNQQNRPQTQAPVRPQNGQYGQNRPQNNPSARPNQGGNTFNRNPQGSSYPNNQNRPYNQGQNQNGYKKPLNGGARPTQTAPANKPQTPVNSVQAENARLLAEMGLGGTKKETARKKPNNHNQKPGNGNFDRDKEDKSVSGPKETFKAQPIVRGASTNVNPDGTVKGPRVIDTHTSYVDLSKYDEKLDQFTSDKDDIKSDLKPGNQKLKKNNGNSQMQAGQTYVNPKFQKGKGKGQKSNVVNTVKPTSIELPEEIVVGQLASKLMVTAGEVVKKLIGMGMMATINQVIDFDTAAIIADEFGVTATQEKVVSIEEKLFDEDKDEDKDLITRAPVICVMGHVDHGKTSILDAIRKTHVTAGEAGGITQHIGAYRVSVKGREITFLDTPGHAAFTAMRARGAMATDIAILVVAADDGIMPQTVEAINHAKAAGIDIIVAINKMDKPAANPDQVKQALTKYDLVPEEWGGDVICVPVSAKTGMGIDDLLESVLLVADVKDLKANPNRRAKGLVIEAKLDKGRGPVATLLVQNGTLHSGDVIIAGTSVGRVRNMTDHNGKAMKIAGPSVPVEITGLAEVPSAGDEFQAVEDEKMARELADKRRAQEKEDNFKAHQRANLNDLFNQISEGIKEINVIVKADVDGSVEAVSQALTKLSNDEVKVRVIHAAAGGITEGDVTFAAASNAIIIGFNVRPDKTAMDSAERQEVDIRTYRVIYECLDEMKAAMKGMLAPKFKENILGRAEVRQTIHISSVGTVAGSYVLDGKVTRQSQIRVVRDGVVIFEDKISSLKRFKDDVKEVAAGYECGIGLEKFNDIKVGDILEAFIMEQVEAELSDNGMQI